MPPITQAILLLNTAFFCLDLALRGWVTQTFALYPLQTAFMPWQLVTYAFLHHDFLHLFFNMLGVWMFGSELERLWGGKRYLQLFVASILSAGLLQMLVVWLLGSNGLTVGASGGLMGLLLANAIMFPNRIVQLLIPPVQLKMKVFVAIFAGIDLFLGMSGATTGVAHFAHLGGMLGAFLMIRYWRGQMPFGRRR